MQKSLFARIALGALGGAVALSLAGSAALRPVSLHAAEPQVANRALRLLVVTGGHEFPESFYALFDGVKDFEWRHAASNHEAFKTAIRGQFDVLILYDMSKDLTEAERTHLVDFLESGKGVVILHHALVDYPEWDWWSREVSGAKYYLQAGGGHPASTYAHDQQLEVEPAASHPVVAGIGRFRIVDETYKGMWISTKVRVLLKTGHPLSDGPLAWLSPYRKSRVVCIQPGHGREAHLNPAYQKLVRNAIRWSAGTQGGGKP